MVGSDIGAVVGGLINNGRSLPSLDLQALFDSISKNQQQNTSLINGLPAELAPLYQAYKAATTGAGSALQSSVSGVGNNLLTQTQNLYGPNSPAVQATLAALKTQDYSTLPQTIENLKSQLAATGGLSRGGATSALTKAVLAPGQAYSQQAANVTGQQLTAQQGAVQQALNKIAQLDDTTAQQIFGMTKDQATQILTSGRADLRDQLTQLINTNNTATQQTLGVEGVQAQQGYQNAVTRNAQQAAVTNGLVNLGVDAGQAIFSAGAGAPGGGYGGGVDFAALQQQGLASTPPPGGSYAPPGY